ncbi:competence protein CoiA [Ectopseudomonas khazarica]|uniref:competence protein CoiA n=1 Tax=Ectopseudomonas khazarica TaxID=2502979 RepID=UPI00142EDBD6|nr:competence protein CoiA family protein [Pseudomonas khazarica]
MEIALVNGVRALPSSGQQGACQACGAPMIAKCGEQLTWHWAHKGRRRCDPWWENEGEWHRAWKKQFPEDYHEVVQHDSTGEKHIADVRLPSGLVVELQHSPMPPDEMRSREAFYDNMVWIVDAGPFLQNITIFDCLPDPSAPFVQDLTFLGPHPLWRTNPVIRNGFDSLMFKRRSEQTDEIYSGRQELSAYYPAFYKGHHLFLWMKAREVWYLTTKPTFLDFGAGRLGQLMRYGPDGWCIRLLAKEQLVADLFSGKNLSDL